MLNCKTSVQVCGKDEISSKGKCIPMLSNLTDIPQYLYTKLRSRLATDYKTISETDGILIDAIQYCNTNKNCDAFRFNYGNKNTRTGVENSEKGHIELLQHMPNYKRLTRQSDIDTPCYSAYIKKTYSHGVPGVIYIEDGNVIYGFDFGKQRDVEKNVPLVQSPYEGVSCRQMIANGMGDSDDTELMKEYCDEHSDLQVCNNFCKNNNYSCTKKIDSQIIFSAGILFIILFFSMYIYARKKEYAKFPVFVTLGILFIIVLVWGSDRLVRYLKPLYNGNKKDNVQNSFYKKCDKSSGCKNIFGKCEYWGFDRNTPVGKNFDCALTDKTTDKYDTYKSCYAQSCRENLATDCCLDGWSMGPDEKCYQDQFKKNNINACHGAFCAGRGCSAEKGECGPAWYAHAEGNCVGNVWGCENQGHCDKYCTSWHIDGQEPPADNIFNYCTCQQDGSWDNVGSKGGKFKSGSDMPCIIGKKSEKCGTK